MAAPLADPRIEEVLRFWFGEDRGAPLSNSQRWFKRSDAFDAEIRERFGALVEAGERGELDEWPGEPHSALAFVIVLDQFPRNIHRDSPLAYAQDARALACTLLGLLRQHDTALPPVWRWFFYLPLMHSEELEHQERCVGLFEWLAAQTTGEVHDALTHALTYAVRHRDVIARFGRFPHRNAVLGRASTPAEREWLEAHPEGF